MILIQWLKFLLLIYNFIFVNKLRFPHILLIYNSAFRIYDLFCYSIILRNFVLVVFLFFPLPILFPFIFFPHFPFALFSFFPYFLFLFFFPNLHHFLNLVCHFLRAPLPCSRTFCCPDNYSKTIFEPNIFAEKKATGFCFFFFFFFFFPKHCE